MAGKRKPFDGYDVFWEKLGREYVVSECGWRIRKIPDLARYGSHK